MAVQTHILIVEDEAIIAMDLRETLCEAGYVVIATVCSGEEALDLCRKQKPDLVLMDVQLQGTLNGIETAQQLRECYEIPCVLLTAHYDPLTLAASQRAGVFAYLIKPYDPRELCATLATALARSYSEVELQRQLQELRCPETNVSGIGHDSLKISTLCAPLTMEFQGRIISGDLFTRTQREILALLLVTANLRVDRELLEVELWPESPTRQARSSFDSNLSRLRKLFNAETDSSAGMEIFSLKNGVLSIENCSVDLHCFNTLDAEGTAWRRKGHVTEAMDSFGKALSLWKGEFLTGLSSHHNVLTVRQHNTQRVYELATWLAGAFALQQRPEEQIDALQLALRAVPSSEKTMTTLYPLLIMLEQREQAKALLKDFTRGLTDEGIDRKHVTAIVRRIEQSGSLECAHQQNT